MTPVLLLALAASAAAAGPCGSFEALTPVTPLSGLALVAAETAEPAEPDDACLAWSLEFAGQLQGTRPVVGLSRELALPRARVEVGARAERWASGRLAIEPVRSGGISGYTGIDGESIVPRVQIAEARFDWERAGLAAAAGVVDDPWVIASQRAWGLPGVAAPMALDLGWMERADLGGWVAWTAPMQLATLTVSSLSGEGYTRRERNSGQDVGVDLRLRPLTLMGEQPPERLVVSGFARSGSRGVAYARNHRAGLRLTSELPVVAGGLELVAAWGVEGDASRTPAGLSAWARTGAALPALAWVRVDYAQHDWGDSDTASTTLHLGVGPSFAAPDGSFPGRVHLALGYRGLRLSDGAAPLAGLGDEASSHTVFLQLGSSLRGLTPLN